MVLPRGSDDDVGGRESDPWAGDGGVGDSGKGVPGIGGGPRSFGQTGEVLSRKNRLQVRFPFEHARVSKKDAEEPGGMINLFIGESQIHMRLLVACFCMLLFHLQCRVSRSWSPCGYSTFLQFPALLVRWM